MAEEESDVIGSLMLNIFRAASQHLGDDKIMEFGLLKTEEERIKYLLQQDEIHKILVFEPEVQGKDSETACKERENGNKYFGKQSYVSAIQSYNEAIRNAPYDKDISSADKKEYLLSLGNRSAALLHIKKYELCLKDIDAAIAEGYPEELQYKLYDRRAKVYLECKDPIQAKQNFEMAKQKLASSKIDGKGLKMWTKTLDKQIKQCAIIKGEAFIPKSSKTAPIVEGEKSETHPLVSSLVEFHYNTNIGRHAVAKENIQVGKVLVQEEPFCQVLLPKFYRSHCYHCLRRCLNPLPDFKWNNIGYCSSECRITAWDDYHKLEYKYQNLLGKEWCAKIGQLAFRLALKIGYSELKDYMIGIRNAPEVEPKRRGFNKDGIYSGGYHAIFNGEINMSKRLPEGLVDFGVFAIFLLKILQMAGFFEEQKDSKIDEKSECAEDLALIGGALFRHLEVIQVNAISVLELQYPNDFEETGPEGVGMGLYPTAALFNHSCDPNADINFYGKNLILRSTRNIKCGEKINIDYGVVYYKDLITVRQEKLQYRYCFQCECIACKEQWPIFKNLEAEIPSFKCTYCDRGLPVGGKLIDDKFVCCDNKKCGHKHDLSQIIQKLQISHDIFSAAMEEIIHGSKEKALPDLQSHLSLMQQTMLPPWRDMTTCQAAIRQCYRLQANVRSDV